MCPSDMAIISLGTASSPPVVPSVYSLLLRNVSGQCNARVRSAQTAANPMLRIAWQTHKGAKLCRNAPATVILALTAGAERVAAVRRLPKGRTEGTMAEAARRGAACWAAAPLREPADIRREAAIVAETIN